MSEHLIDEDTLRHAVSRVRQRPLREQMRQMSREEPDLYQLICQVDNNVFSDAEGVELETQEMASRALWDAVFKALEAYRLAHYRLWQGTELGDLLTRLGPGFGEASGPDPAPPDVGDDDSPSSGHA